MRHFWVRTIPQTAIALVLGAASLPGQSPPPTEQKAEQKAEPKTPTKRPTTFRVAAGDLDGDGKAEIIRYNGDTKELVIARRTAAAEAVVSRTTMERFPGAMVVADVDGDGNGELVIAEGLPGYNPKTGPQTDVQLRIYEPLETGAWTSTEVYRQESERPEITTLEVADLDGDRRPEILLAYFSEKYFVDICVASRGAHGWTVEKRLNVRMGAHVGAGDLLDGAGAELVVGRPYGDAQPSLGDAFVLHNGRRVLLPAFRGVSSVAIGNLDGDQEMEVVVGDGWHQNYGKIARGRLAVMDRTGERWEYQLVEDIPSHTRVRDIELVDLNGDGIREIVARGERMNSLGGDVRVYERAKNAWRGATIATDVQQFAIADVDGDGRREAVFAGETPAYRPLGLESLPWDAALAPEVETYEVDPTTLIDHVAPRIQATEWIGSEPRTLEALKGKVVMLDFWATWCKPCIAQFPTIKAWQKKYGDDLVIIGMTNHSSQTSNDVRDFLAKTPLPWPVAIDPNNRTHMDYGVSPIPHTFLIDRLGRVQLTHVGGGKLEAIEKKLDELIGRQP